MNHGKIVMALAVMLAACGGGSSNVEQPDSSAAPSPFPTPAPSPTSSPMPTASPSASPTPSSTPAPTASATPSPTATATPTPSPSATPTASPAPPNAAIEVLSNRPDLVSGGDVLVEVVLESATEAPNLRLFLNAQDVTGKLEADNGNPSRLIGLIDGLDLGLNTLSLNNGNSLEVINHPRGGPVFTGPQIQPWTCRNPDAVDAQCNQDVTYQWLYLSTNPATPELQPYDVNDPPGDVASTTTDNGETVPFIVLEESGYQARDKYTIRTLQKPSEGWTPASPQSQWNRRLLITHGGNCRGHHQTGSPRFDDYAGTIPPNPAVEQSFMKALGAGWAVASASQLNLGHNCNLSYQAESLMMLKERFVEQYGALRYTVGTGCSGGAITQNMIANAYPGLYQGLLTTCTYPDVMSTATQFADYHILLRYFQTVESVGTVSEPPGDFEEFQQRVEGLFDNVVFTTARDGTNYTITQQNAIYGHDNGVVNAYLANDALFSEAVDPQSDCGGIPDGEHYHPVNNPDGARCDVLTFMQNMVGARQRFDLAGNDRWSQIEQDLGYGFAGYPLGNQGVQYGLEAMRNGLITPAQFLALNINIGGVDMDLNVTPERLAPDYPALPNAYRTGIMNTIVNMDTVAIINMTGPDPGAAHDSVHGYWVRWRLEREFGNRDNFVHWGGATALIGDPEYMNLSLDAMASWLDAVEADTGAAPLAEKLVSNKPASVQDQCNRVPGAMCPEQAMLVFGTPRTVAGADRHGDQVQCQLRPFSRDDYYVLAEGVPVPVSWTEEQWQQLEAAFDVNGQPMVCDWSLRPLEWQPTIPWLSYQDEAGAMVTGGEQMSPADFPVGWASPAFSGAWAPGWQP